MRFLDSPRFRSIYLPLVLFSLFAGDAWRYSTGWYGFGFIAVAMTVVGVILIVRARKRGVFAWNRFPFFLVVFLSFATLSIAWSFYRGATALGLLTTWMTAVIAVSLAVSFSWAEILRGLGIAMRVILGLSLLFELFVSTVVRSPLLPLVPQAGVDYGSYEKIPKLLYWSRDLLFEGGKIQGIVGNSSLLAFVALIGLLVFCVQFAARSVRRGAAAFWIVVAVANIALTRSATITIAIAVLAAVVVLVLLLRAAGPKATVAIYAAVIAMGVAATVLVTQFSPAILGLLGKSDDLTGRLDIWEAVIALAQERAAFGWGWVSWWVPWVAPFDTLAFEAGVRQLHAHNAWLDVFLQLGVVGLVVFGLFVVGTGIRSWQLATQPERLRASTPARFTALSLLPLLLLTALLVQSLAESRLLIEYGLLTLTIIAVKTKLGERADQRRVSPQ